MYGRHILERTSSSDECNTNCERSKEDAYEERLRRLKMTTLENRRLRGAMIETWHILNGREDIDSSQFSSNGNL